MPRRPALLLGAAAAVVLLSGGAVLAQSGALVAEQQPACGSLALPPAPPPLVDGDSLAHGWRTPAQLAEALRQEASAAAATGAGSGVAVSAVVLPVRLASFRGERLLELRGNTQPGEPAEASLWQARDADSRQALPLNDERWQQIRAAAACLQPGPGRLWPAAR